MMAARAVVYENIIGDPNGAFFAVDGIEDVCAGEDSGFVLG